MCYAKTSAFAAGLAGGTRKYFETDDLIGRPWRIHDLTKQTSASERPNSFFTIKNPKTGEEYPANPNRTWAITQETFEKYYAENRIVFPNDYDFLKITKPVLRYFQEDDMAKAGTRFGYIPVSTKLPENIGMTQDGTQEIIEMFGSKILEFPKPLALIEHFIKMATSTTKNRNDIVLDFFSGSATTAHAVMRLNAEDGGNRRFIMVQLPEICDKKSEAAKSGYHNICEIGKERIRRAGKKLKEALSDHHTAHSSAEKRSAAVTAAGVSEENVRTADSLDTGFKVFRLDSSNLRLWDNTPIETGELDSLFARMEGIIDSLKPDRSEADLVYEILLKMGYPLTADLAAEEVDGLTVYTVEHNRMLICLQPGVTAEMVEKLAALRPRKIVLAENALLNNSDMSNVCYLLENRGIELKFV